MALTIVFFSDAVQVHRFRCIKLLVSLVPDPVHRLLLVYIGMCHDHQLIAYIQ